MPLVVISSNAGTRMGGEAIKAFQFFEWLRARNVDAYLLTHARNGDELNAAFGPDRVILIPDTRLQKALWRSRVLAFALLPVFHRMAAHQIRQRFDAADTVLHYLCPITPYEPRFAPRGFRMVLGPLNGNIDHPPGFGHRARSNRRLIAALRGLLNKLSALLARDHRNAHHVLVSGGERTRAVLRRAGVVEDRMRDVCDSGIDAAVLRAPRAQQRGHNGRFLCIARLVEYKAIDLAIRALAQCPDEVTLDIAGNGPEAPTLQALANDLGVASRVNFLGYVDHAATLAMCGTHRALVFPSLAEANGIAMQEAMSVGMPVIALRWGGMAALADDRSACFVEPVDEQTLVADLAAAMTRLANDADHADALSQAARRHAERYFCWDDVALSWTQPYRHLIPDKPAQTPLS